MTKNELIAYSTVLQQCEGELSELEWYICKLDPIELRDRIVRLHRSIADLRRSIGETDDAEVEEDDSFTPAETLAKEAAAVAPVVVGDSPFSPTLVIGSISELNGADAVLVEGFQPTRAELKRLGLNYLEQHYSERICSVYGYSGSTEWRVIRFSGDRFDAIYGALGHPVVEFDLAIRRHEKQLDAAYREAEQMQSQYGNDSSSPEERLLNSVETTGEEEDEDFIRRMQELESEMDHGR